MQSIYIIRTQNNLKKKRSVQQLANEIEENTH